MKKLQALKDYYNKYFSQANSRNACINRRGYWQMLAIVVPCHILVLYATDYLDRTIVSPHGSGFLSFILPLISSPYFIPLCFLAFFHIALFFTIAHHRCRDIGISHWYIFLILVPYAKIASIIIIVPDIRIAFIIILGCLETGAVEKYRKKYRKKHSLRKNKKTGL